MGKHTGVSLAALPVGPVIPVSDLDRSLEFYEGALGLSGEAIPAGYLLHCGGDTVIYLLAGTGYAGDGVRIAWVRDPDRQVLSIFQPL